MAEGTTGSNVLDDFEKLKSKIRQETSEIINPSQGNNKGGTPQEPNQPTGNPDPNPNPNPGGDPSTPENTPPSEEYDATYYTGGESYAYGLDKMGKEPAQPRAKFQSGAAKAPERKKSGYKPEGGKDFLQVCYNEIIVAAYAGAIDFAVDITLDLADWILFAPFSGGNKVEKKPDKEKNKTIFNYADDIIAENNAKGKILAKSFLEHHKEIMDNIERKRAGQTPEWHVWKGQEPACFEHLVEIKTKAETDPNSPEAAQWNEFKDLPRKALTSINNQINMLNFAVHNAALTTEMTDVEPLPTDVIKGFNNMEKAVENPKLNDSELKANLTNEINNMRQHIATPSPINAEITENLNEMAQLLLDPNCTRENIAEKIVKLKGIHPIKHKLKEKAAETFVEIRKNFNKIRKAYENDPERAREELAKYAKQIKDTQKEAMNRKQRDLDAMWVTRNIGVGKFGHTKRRVAIATRRASNSMRYVNVSTQGRQEDAPLKKQIENDKDIQNLINQVGIRR